MVRMLKMFYTYLLFVGWTITGIAMSIHHNPNINNVSVSNNISVINNNNYSTVFEVPSNVDEDELLHETGLFMTSIMNLSVDPCENFYEYACGNWPFSERVPKQSRRDGVLQAISAKIDQLIIRHLKNNTEVEPKQSTTTETKVKAFFLSCLKSKKEFSLEVKNLLEEQDFLFGMIQNKSTNDWITLNFLSPYGIYPFLPLTVNYSNTFRRYELYLNTPYELLNAFSNKSNASIFGTQRNSTEFKIALEFERNLTAKVSPLKKVEHGSLSQFLEQHKKDPVDWKRVFHEAFKGFANNEWYINNKIANFTDLERFLRKSKYETLRSYMKWRTILKFYQIWQTNIANDREKTCLQHSETYFTYALMPWYIRVMFDENRREDVLKIAEFLKKHFNESVQTAKWLDEETKSQVLAKLNSMDIIAGYTDKMHHSSYLDATFKDVNISEDWFKNLMILEAYRSRQSISSVHQTELPSLLSPYSVNGYYADFMNKIFVPIGVFQMPFYHISLPSSLKFGGIGLLLGHEMAHGFDTKFYKLNYDGKLENRWSSSAMRHFREHNECFKNQYNKFIYGGVGTKASITLDDNVADNNGARLAYNAYMHCAGYSEGMNRPLPDTNFTNNELFFIKLAQTWCTGHNGTSKVNRIKNYKYTYEEFRVLGILQNMPEFSETFQCKLGSEMNPFKKCTLW